jgi:predicted amidohydrolase
MDDLRVALVQADLHWELPEANRAMLEEMLWQLPGPADVVVLPEMFTTGFTMRAAQVAEPMGLHTTRWMLQQARQLDAAVVGSFVVKDGGQCFNRLLWAFPDGRLAQYDKRHLFRMAREHEAYAPGRRRLVVEWRGWRCCPLVCYDLRFPVWSRNAPDPDGRPAYDCLLYVANWPEARIQAWDTLLQARAIENLAYAVGVNRTGTDGAGIAYCGHSAAAGPKGEILAHAGRAPGIALAVCSAQALREYREKFPAHLDADPFQLL